MARRQLIPMTTARLPLRVLAVHLSGWGPRLGLAALALGPWAIQKASGLLASPWMDSVERPHGSLIGCVIGLYISFKLCALSSFVSSRVDPDKGLLLRLGVPLLSIGLYSLAGYAGDAMARPESADQILAVLWRVLVLASVGAAAQVLFRGHGLPFLAALALCWWIPAMLPPSFLLAVPRALREVLAGNPTLGMPHNPAAWLADTTFVGGLLLLAWSARWPQLRVDEIRDPR